jgi:hypothetical protein
MYWPAVTESSPNKYQVEREKMDRRIVSLALAAVLASVGAAFAGSAADSEPATAEVPVTRATTHAELNEKWCAADPNVEQIFVLPASLFVDSEQLICDSGPYKLYRIIEHDDTDDFEYFLDPPVYGKANRLGCDGKAGRTMQTIAVNCRPLK